MHAPHQQDLPTDGLRRALTQGLDLPLAALRISLESLTHELQDGSVGAPLLRGLLDEVERLGKNVRGLLEFAGPVEPRPAKAKLREVVNCLRRRLSADERRRFDFALVGRAGELVTDVPLLARCLERFVRNSFEAGSAKALLIVRQHEDGTTFAVLDRAGGGFDAGEAPHAFQTTKPNQLGLGLTLAERDICALGGRFDLECSPLGSTRARLFLPAGAPTFGPSEDKA